MCVCYMYAYMCEAVYVCLICMPYMCATVYVCLMCMPYMCEAVYVCLMCMTYMYIRHTYTVSHI